MKKKITTIRELWSVPKYRNLFKLGGYFVFFGIFFLMASITQNNAPTKEISKEPNEVSYSSMKQEVLNNNLKIKYTVTSSNTYFLDGTIINNIFSGTLEVDESLKKIKIEKEEVYLIEKNATKLAPDLLTDINPIYLFPSNIINIINTNSSVMKQNNNEKIYKYNINNKEYNVYSNTEVIYKMIVKDEVINYELEFEIIK